MKISDITRKEFLNMFWEFLQRPNIPLGYATGDAYELFQKFISESELEFMDDGC